MTKDDALGLFLRGLGAWEAVQGFEAFPAILIVMLRLVIGIILFFGAGYLVELTYGRRPAPIIGES